VLPSISVTEVGKGGRGGGGGGGPQVDPKTTKPNMSTINVIKELFFILTFF
jgi:hypothetical protein